MNKKNENGVICVDEIILLAGGINKMARFCDVTTQTVYQWKKIGKIPAERALDVAKSAKIHVNNVRPDIYPLDIIKEEYSADI